MLRKQSTFTNISSAALAVPSDIGRKTASKLANKLDLPEGVGVIPGKIILATRAISNRCNDNGDFFGSDQLLGKFGSLPAHNDEYGYRTFLGNPTFVNHHNSNDDDPRGCIIASNIFQSDWTDDHDKSVPRIQATAHESTDTWVKVYHEIDADRYPLTALAITKGLIKSTSMGCDIEFSKCSVCGNEARYTTEYCSHISAYKMAHIFDTDHGPRLAYEENYGLQFFEDSLLTVDPADPTADVLEVMHEKAASKTAGRESVRMAGESVTDWLARRAEIVQSSFTKQVPFLVDDKEDKLATVARRQDESIITRSNALATNRKLVAAVKSKKFALTVKASNPEVIWITDLATRNVAYYGRLKSTASNTALKQEMLSNGFEKFAREIFEHEAKLAQDNDAVQNLLPDGLNGTPSEVAAEADEGSSVQDVVPADTTSTPSDSVESVDGGDDVQDTLPAPYDQEADSDAVDHGDDSVVVARRIVAEDDDQDEDSEDDQDEDSASDEEDSDDKDDKMASRRRRVADAMNVEDKGVSESDTLDAPQNESPTTDKDDPDHGAPDESLTSGDPSNLDSVEDKGVQVSPDVARRRRARQFQMAVDRKVAAQMDKMKQALDLASHQARIGEINSDLQNVIVTAKRIYDKTSTSDIKAKIEVYAKMNAQASSRRTAGVSRIVPSNVMNKQRLSAASAKNDVAFDAMLYGN